MHNHPLVRTAHPTPVATPLSRRVRRAHQCSVGWMTPFSSTMSAPRWTGEASSTLRKRTANQAPSYLLETAR